VRPSAELCKKVERETGRKAEGLLLEVRRTSPFDWDVGGEGYLKIVYQAGSRKAAPVLWSPVQDKTLKSD